MVRPAGAVPVKLLQRYGELAQPPDLPGPAKVPHLSCEVPGFWVYNHTQDQNQENKLKKNNDKTSTLDHRNANNLRRIRIFPV